eukprot:scaffold680_cov264-Pinguiococcus_pyrenoidosus.AAC.13
MTLRGMQGSLGRGSGFLEEVRSGGEGSSVRRVVRQLRLNPIASVYVAAMVYRVPLLLWVVNLGSSPATLLPAPVLYQMRDVELGGLGTRKATQHTTERRNDGSSGLPNPVPIREQTTPVSARRQTASSTSTPRFSDCARPLSEPRVLAPSLLSYQTADANHARVWSCERETARHPLGSALGLAAMRGVGPPELSCVRTLWVAASIGAWRRTSREARGS